MRSIVCPLLQNQQPGVATCAIQRRHQTPLASFFIVAASVHPCSAVLYRTESMVAQAGQPSGWPIFVGAGIATPVWATHLSKA
ncbi:ash family protein [Erwinia tracheiphila]|uniref:ash family protein n=1 Tax=Erwinia tracheiphila TaxID=65700 RepID=UPI001F48CFBC|nr:ash family protein [Erwinia tracheiphila]UIA82976.1 ash family protein [Erwinia tracheiphila]UIA91556.1 ash family protein [Erwinia tracheiphila]